MNRKHCVRTTTLTAAVLVALLGSAGAYAASRAPSFENVKGPAAAAPADAGSGNRIVIRYKNANDSAAKITRADAVADKLAVVRSALSRAGLASAGATANAAGTAAPSYLRRLGTGSDLVKLPGKYSRAQLDKLVAELASDPQVERAEVDAMWRPTELRTASTVKPQLVPNDPHYAAYQWHLHDSQGGINVQDAWDVSQGEGVVVAVLDTGILYDHPDLAGTHVLEGYDFISNAATSRRDSDARVPGALDYGDWEASNNECYEGSLAANSSWHGTHVSGTVAETSNNAVGVAGVASKATVLPVRVLGKCGGSTADITDAITWASGGSVEGVPDNTTPAEIINMSLGGGGSCSSEWQAAIDGAVARGTTVVVAAGNSGDDAASYTPAGCKNVVTVGASRINGGIAYYSNYGKVVDLAGPGGGADEDGSPTGYVWQSGYTGATTPTSGDYDYVGMAGTSMASPHVAAVAALVQSALVADGKDALTPAALETLLKDSARAFPVSIPSSTPIGTGIVDATAALNLALKGPGAVVVTALTNKVAVNAPSGAAGTEKVYSFKAEAGKPLNIISYGGSGNVSLHVGTGTAPENAVYDAKSTRPGNSETVRITTPAAGTYYIKLVGTDAYSGVSVMARQ